MVNRENLEEKFRCYQSILAEEADAESGKIDLDEITHDFCSMGVDGDIAIHYIPAEGDFVYLSLDLAQITGKENQKVADVKYWISDLGENQFAYLVEVMRKAMIIKELRNTYDHGTK